MCIRDRIRKAGLRGSDPDRAGFPAQNRKAANPGSRKAGDLIRESRLSGFPAFRICGVRLSGFPGLISGGSGAKAGKPGGRRSDLEGPDLRLSGFPALDVPIGPLIRPQPPPRSLQEVQREILLRGAVPRSAHFPVPPMEDPSQSADRPVSASSHVFTQGWCRCGHLISGLLTVMRARTANACSGSARAPFFKDSSTFLHWAGVDQHARRTAFRHLSTSSRRGRRFSQP